MTTSTATLDALTVNEAAIYLHVSPDTVRRAMREGVLPFYYLGTAARIRRATLDAFVARQERATGFHIDAVLAPVGEEEGR